MSPAVSNPLQIIDISKNDLETAKLLFQAANTQGFLFVDGHEFFQSEVDEIFATSKGYFNTPIEDKIKCPITEDGFGYTGFNEEALDPEYSKSKKGDPKETFNFNHFNYVTGESTNELPKYFAEREEIVKNAAKKFHATATRILTLLAMGLEIEEGAGGAHYFTDRHRPDKKSSTAMRFLHYPATSKLDSTETIRAGAHTDYGSITLLFQLKEEGLELLSPISKGWEKVPYIDSPNQDYRSEGRAPPLVVNIADQLSFWTAGILRSTVHRVKLPQSEFDRYSVAFFVNAEEETLLEPVPSPITLAVKGRGANSKGEIYTSKQWLEKRVKLSFNY